MADIASPQNNYGTKDISTNTRRQATDRDGAKGGSGDVLTGLVGGLLARGYSAVDAAGIGAWIHGYAGDVLTEECTAEAYSSRDLIERLWTGFVRLYYPE